jgi:hypothetical protein
MRYAILGLVMMVAAGCVRPPIEGRAEPYGIPQVNFADPELANYTSVSPPQMKRENGILYVTLPIRSASDFDLHVDYKVAFLDQSGTVIYESGWTGGTTIPRNSWTYIKVNSTSANAADFHLQLRYAQ